ncbi:hypothetical protein [Roseicitreum antarcticum]|uniref:hypothetical protein n=1 Tax=Roseicitreum antarcticum TaxID=564137 RepID=UPI00115F7C4B|nr:hypothetical protein [Roseicitreum antarcticum]
MQILEQIMLWAGLVLAWASGEAGRIFVAGGAGSLTRWLFSERRRIRDGAVQVITGSLLAHYMWPWTLAVMTVALPSLGGEPDSKVMAGFVSGLVGISAAKIALAMIEARAGGRDNGTP